MIEIVRYPKCQWQKLRMRCKQCDCIFDATYGEIKQSTYQNKQSYMYERTYEINCPCCGKYLVFTQNEVEYWDVIPAGQCGYDQWRITPQLFNIEEE